MILLGIAMDQSTYDEEYNSVRLGLEVVLSRETYTSYVFTLLLTSRNGSYMYESHSAESCDKDSWFEIIIFWRKVTPRKSVVCSLQIP